jgi:hypothetical protein
MVESVAFSSHGTVLVSGSSDGIRLWNLLNGTELRVLAGHPSGIRSLAFSPDGTLLAAGSRDGVVQLWDLATGDLMKTLNGHVGWVNELAFSPDGRTLVSGGGDGTMTMGLLPRNARNNSKMGSERVLQKFHPCPISRRLKLNPSENDRHYDSAQRTQYIPAMNAPILAALHIRHRYLLLVMIQKSAPVALPSLRSGRDTPPFQNIFHGGGVKGYPQLMQFSNDLVVTPAGIVTRYLGHQRFNVRLSPWAATRLLVLPDDPFPPH